MRKMVNAAYMTLDDDIASMQDWLFESRIRVDAGPFVVGRSVGGVLTVFRGARI